MAFYNARIIGPMRDAFCSIAADLIVADGDEGFDAAAAEMVTDLVSQDEKMAEAGFQVRNPWARFVQLRDDDGRPVIRRNLSAA